MDSIVKFIGQVREDTKSFFDNDRFLLPPNKA